MTDMEKVVRDLRYLKSFGRVSNNPQITEIAEYAIALLKEQEAVKPGKEHSSSGVTWWNVCGNCKTAINPNDKFCHECGKKVKWE